MKLSVLDQSTAAEGAGQDVAIRETLALARHCEQLGYHRYWLSEHHASDSIVGTAPEVLMAAIAATTTRIRVGSAGVMLPLNGVSQQWLVSSATGLDSSRVTRVEFLVFNTGAFTLTFDADAGKFTDRDDYDENDKPYA